MGAAQCFLRDLSIWLPFAFPVVMRITVSITSSGPTSECCPIRLYGGKVWNDGTRTVAKCDITDVLWCQPYCLPLLTGRPNQEDNVDNMRTTFLVSKVGSDYWAREKFTQSIQEP